MFPSLMITNMFWNFDSSLSGAILFSKSQKVHKSCYNTTGSVWPIDKNITRCTTRANEFSLYKTYCIHEIGFFVRNIVYFI